MKGYKAVIAALLIAMTFIGCSGESGPTMVYDYPFPDSLTIVGSINLSDVAISPELFGTTNLDYRPFDLEIQDQDQVTTTADEEGRFSFEPVSIRQQFVVFAKHSEVSGLVLEFMAADSDGLYSEFPIEISIRSTARSLIARCLRDRYGRRIDPQALKANHIDETVKAIANVLESRPDKLNNTTLDQVEEIKAAYTAKAESLNQGESGVIPAQLVLMYYIAGDNDLSNYLNSNLARIKEAGAPEGGEILVQADFPIDGMKRLVLQKDDWLELGAMQDIDSSSAAVVADFVAFSRRAFPAAKYALIISSHADGWKQANDLRASLITDDTSQTRGNPVEIAAWINGANKQFDGFIRPLELLVFDACNMGLIEIAWEFKDCAEYLVFSQAFVPGNGFPHDQILNEIEQTNTAESSAESLGKIFCQQYRDLYLDGTTEGAVTVSMIDTANLDAAVNKLEAFFARLLADIGNTGTVLASLRDHQTASVDDEEENNNSKIEYVIQAFEQTDYRDIVDFLKESRNAFPAAKLDIDSALAALAETIKVNYNSSYYFPDANGLSIGFPDKTAFDNYYNSAEHLKYYYYKFAQETSWYQILTLINN
ncbi:MAG: clostripain-related cysteine peptidase [Candidatus Rifleibacteriota bacterium]